MSHQVVDAKERLALRILIDQKVDYPLFHIPDILLQHIIADQFDVGFIVLFEKGGNDVGSFRCAHKNPF
jgi:hypothetical protein